MDEDLAGERLTGVDATLSGFCSPERAAAYEPRRGCSDTMTEKIGEGCEEEN